MLWSQKTRSTRETKQALPKRHNRGRHCRTPLVDVDEDGFHSPRFSFGFPRCGSFREGLNTCSTCRFDARRMPLRAIIVGPFFLATRIRHFMAAGHSGASCRPWAALRDVVAGVAERDKLAPAGKRTWILKRALPRTVHSRIKRN